MNKKLSFENTKRLLDRGMMVNDKIHELVYDGVCESIKQATREVNKAVYEMAEKSGVSVWEICFHFIPEYGPHIEFKKDGDEVNGYTMQTDVKLVPVELELEKGPDYWEAKYLQLKEKMQKLLDENEDE